jgi:hypothetical protein
VDYAALLAVIAVAFAGAGAATGAARLHDVPARVAHVVRTGICIVGGDVCRAADAAAEGLTPCILDERAKGSGMTVTIVSLRLGGKGEWTVARRSDGSVLVTRSDENRVGASGGLGFELGPFGAGVSGSLDVTVGAGEAWELPSAAAAARLLAAVRAGEPPGVPPTWRFGDLGEEAAVGIGIDAAGTPLTGVEASWRDAAGARVGRGETTLYLHAGAEVTAPLDLLADLGLPARGSSAAPAGGRTGPLLLSLTRGPDGLRELAFRRVERGRRAGEVVETVGRLDLRDPANRAAADRLLRARLPWTPAVAGDLRAVLGRTVRVGTVERSVYAVQDESRDFAAAARLGVELGIDASVLDSQRHLVAASVWSHGSPERRRVDCVGDAA